MNTAKGKQIKLQLYEGACRKSCLIERSVLPQGQGTVLVVETNLGSAASEIKPSSQEEIKRKMKEVVQRVRLLLLL